MTSNQEYGSRVVRDRSFAYGFDRPIKKRENIFKNGLEESRSGLPSPVFG